MAHDEDAPPAARVALPFAAGVLAGGLTSMPALAGALPAAALAIGAAVALLRRLDRAAPRALIAAASAGLGLGACLAAVAALPLPPAHLARFTGPASAAVEGIIVWSERAGARTTLTLAADHLRGRRRHGTVTGRLGITIAHPRRSWRAGERVRVVGRLRRPRNFGNPGGYDLEGALARRGVRVTMFLWDDRTVEALPTDGRPSAGGRLAALEARVEERLTVRTREPVRGFLTAVLLGSTRSVDAETRAALARTGLAHVVSVSGFHIAVAAAACVWLGRWLAARSPLALHLDVGKLAMVLGLPPVAAYAAIAAESIPAGRAFLTYGVVLAAVLLDRRADGLRALAIAAVLLALPVPNIAADASFQLSFAAVLGLVLVLRRPAVTGWRRWLVQPLVVSVAATVVTAPLTAWHFQQVSLVAPLANLLALPLLGPATLVPGLAALPLIAVAPALADRLLDVAGAAAGAGLAVAAALARLPGAATATPMPSVLELGACYAALALWWWRPALPPRVRRTAAALLAVVVVADASYWLWQRSGAADLRVTFLSVGQGDAAVAELPRGGVLVIDGGGFAGDFDTGERLVAPFLRARKIGRIDALVLSHPQLDHYGGLAHLAERFAPREIWWTGARATAPAFARLERALAAAGTRPRVLRRGMRWTTAPGVGVEVLHPDGLERYGVNDASLVLRLTHGATAFLFAGDVERAAEASMLRAGAPLAATVLKVPHHGSATSSTAPWLAAVTPAIAVVSTGAHNRFGFPSPDVLRRLRGVGATTWNTAAVGAVRVVSDGRRVAATVMHDPVRERQFEIPTSLW